MNKLVCTSLAAVALAASAASTHAAPFTTTTSQAAGDTNNWNAAIWNPGPVAPTAGNTYEALPGSRVRSPNGTAGSGGTAVDGQTFTFPGDSLQFTGIGFSTAAASGEFRFKQNFNNPVFNFPGVGGNPGLIMNGGILNDGDDHIMTISGSIRAVPGTTSSINPGGGAVTDIGPLRGFILTATITGSGGFSLDYGHDVTTPAVLVSSSNPTFTGNWTVNAGWLEGGGANALGSGNITLTSSQGASTLDLDYNLTNPTGSLTLMTTSSKLTLDQNLTFGAVSINGTNLLPGVYTEPQLASLFPSNISSNSNAASTLTVVPEPAGAILALIGGVALFNRRRRSLE